MATKNSTHVLAVDNSDELKNILEPVATAAWFSSLHMIVLGDPGYGKTSILDAMSRQVWGNEAYRRFTGAPSMKAETIIGQQNSRYLLDPDPEANGIPFWNFRNSVLDPRFHHVLISELPRNSEIANDLLVHMMDGLPLVIDDMLINYNGEIRTIFADGNWWSSTFRNAALADRFSMWVWYSTSVSDAESIMSKPPISQWQFNVPTKDEIMNMRSMLQDWRKNPKGTKALRTIVEAVNEIIRILPATQFSVNNRRVRQWQDIMWTMGAYYSGQSDFTTIPGEAFEALTCAYPLKNPQEALQWRGIVMSVVDTTATAIAEFEGQIYSKWKDLYEKMKRANAQERIRIATTEIAPDLQRAQEELSRRWQNDKRAQQTSARLMAVYQKILRGEPLE